MAKTVDEYLEEHAEWSAVLEPLRTLLRDSELDETVKWGAPVYVLGKRNVVGLGAFKAYAGLWFHDGSFLDDPDGVLINAQEGKTRGMRQWRFAENDVPDLERVGAYVEAAIQNAKAGKGIQPRRNAQIETPPILAAALAEDPDFDAAFKALTPGRQREYAEHIGSAKREATQESRLAKARPMILAGTGLNDRYKRS